MQHLKRLLWLLVAGFVTAAGASLAFAIAIEMFQNRYDERRKAEYRPNPLNYQAPPAGTITVTDLTLLEITQNGGVRGNIANTTGRKINSFNANLSFFRNDDLLYSCNETVLVEVENGKSARFQLLCKEVERSALKPDVTPRLNVVWVYPSRGQ